MNVKKININQSEPTYNIASDAYNITYEDSNVGEKLSDLDEEVGKVDNLCSITNGETNIKDLFTSKRRYINKSGHISVANSDNYVGTDFIDISVFFWSHYIKYGF